MPRRQALVIFIEHLLKKYPPTFLPHVEKDNSVKAYQELIGEYPELLLSSLFFKIYQSNKTAAQITDEILSPNILKQKKKREEDRKPRSRERGLSLSNKVLLDADRIINHPGELIERYKCTIDEDEFNSLLQIAHGRMETGASIDRFFSMYDYSDQVRKLIAHSLHVIYEVGILFRTELYKSYAEKSKTVKKMPETDVYYHDAQKLKTPLRGKQTLRDTVRKDAEEYRKYLMSHCCPN